MLWRTASGTPPRNTRDSVPRLMPLNSLSTRTSPPPGAASTSSRSSAWPGPITQSARARSSLLIQITLEHHVTGEVEAARLWPEPQRLIQEQARAPLPHEHRRDRDLQSI